MPTLISVIYNLLQVAVIFGCVASGYCFAQFLVSLCALFQSFQDVYRSRATAGGNRN